MKKIVIGLDNFVVKNLLFFRGSKIFPNSLFHCVLPPTLQVFNSHAFVLLNFAGDSFIKQQLYQTNMVWIKIPEVANAIYPEAAAGRYWPNTPWTAFSASDALMVSIYYRRIPI